MRNAVPLNFHPAQELCAPPLYRRRAEGYRRHMRAQHVLRKLITGSVGTGARG